MKKSILFFALLLASCMVVGLAGCGNNLASSPSPSGKAASATTAVSASASPAVSESAGAAVSTTVRTVESAAAEPVKITLMIQSDQSTFEQTSATSPVWKDIADKIGVIPSFISGDAEKSSLMLSSGDLPDIVNAVQLTTTEDILLKSGQLIELDDLLKQYGQDIQANFSWNLDFNRKVHSLNTGKLFLLPGPQIGPAYDNKEAAWALQIRWDLYKEQGAPKYNNMDDLLAILKKMVDAHPTADDGQKTYGVSCFTDWGLEFQYDTYAMSWTGSPLYRPYTFLTKGPDDKNPVMVSNFGDPNSPMWQNVEFYYKANQLGIFDKDGLTQKWDQFKAKYDAGAVMLCDANWATADYTSANNTKAKGYLAILPPAGSGTYVQSAKYCMQNPVGWNNYDLGITKNCKNPDKAMQLLNYWASYDGARTMFSGAKGQQWDIVNGKPEILPETMALNAAGGQPWADLAINAPTFYSFSPFSPQTVDPNDGAMLNLFDTDAAMAQGNNPLQQDYSNFYGVQYPAQVFFNALDSRTINNNSMIYMNQVAVALMTPLSDDMKLILTKIEGLAATDFADCVLAKDKADFDAKKAAAIADFNANGLDTLWAQYQKDWTNAVDAAKSMGK